MYYVFVVGELRNDSDTDIDSIVIESKFYDADDNLVDASTDQLYTVTVPAHGNAAFRAQFLAAADADVYVRHESRIMSENSYADYANTCGGDGEGLGGVLISLLISSIPILLLIGVWIYFMRRTMGKNSAQTKSLELIEKQVDLIAEQNSALRDIADSMRDKD